MTEPPTERVVRNLTTDRTLVDLAPPPPAT
jgi:hypothetical protein